VAAEMTDADMRKIRYEIGTAPDDNAVADAWDEVGGGVVATALAILRPRLADGLASAAAGGATIPGAISVTPPTQLAMLSAQVSRLEAQLASVTGEPDDSGLAATSVIASRSDRWR
jgi:microcystin degradation protein MlrC